MEYARRQRSLSDTLVDAELAHLVLGQTLYLKDPRNTPVEVYGHEPSTASFTVRVSDFEDAGVEWVLPLWDVSKFLVPPSAKRLSSDEYRSLGRHIDTFHRTTRIEAHAESLATTLAEIRHRQRDIEQWLTENAPNLPADANALTCGTTPCGAWSDALGSYLDAMGLAGIERDFVTGYASNPHAGEMIKGHRMVLAELGLCPYVGDVVRDQATFEGAVSKSHRRAHILTRLAFMRILFAKCAMPAVPLYRTIYSDQALSPPRNTGFVSATFSHDVATALFTSAQERRHAAMYWQSVSVDRVFATYFETPALSARYEEAEAILLFDSETTTF
mgnify:CR=1 FL=1